MHELSIALSILDVAAEEAAKQTGEVLAIHLKLGPLSGVVKEALVAAFELARDSSALPTAQLVVEETPIVAFCPNCQATGPVLSPQMLVCERCGTPAGDLVSGRELEIVALELRET